MVESRSWKWGAPRLITRPQLRAYLQIEEAELEARLSRGQVPGPLWGCDAALSTARWDRHAIDRAVDRASSLTHHVEAAAQETDDAFGFQATSSSSEGARRRFTAAARQAG